MSDYVELNGLLIAKSLHDLVANEIAPGTAISNADFWTALAVLVDELGPINEQLLAKRAALQRQLDIWHGAHLAAPIDVAEYKDFLREIGYLLADPSTMNTKAMATTANDDTEIAHLAGPQLVVPLDNARYAVNAANARLG
ncbi:MAG: malate synthase [Gammaproteobacteria bacterium]|jgi:malate synthase